MLSDYQGCRLVLSCSDPVELGAAEEVLTNLPLVRTRVRQTSIEVLMKDRSQRALIESAMIREGVSVSVETPEVTLNEVFEILMNSQDGSEPPPSEVVHAD